MDDELVQYLKNLRLKRMLEILEEEIATAQKKDSTYEEFLLRLVRVQRHHRQEKALEWRIKRAKIPFPWTLESFPFKKQPGVSRRQIRNFAALDFLSRAENIVFIGKTDHATYCITSLCAYSKGSCVWPEADGGASRPPRTAVAAAVTFSRSTSSGCTIQGVPGAACFAGRTPFTMNLRTVA